MENERVREIPRVFGSAPWLKLRDCKDYRVKVFKSGNSVALRLPAELGLKPGLEMNLRVENGEIVSVEPIDRPKRKFNVAKVCRSASSLNPIIDNDRSFDERQLVWRGVDEAGPA